MPWQWAREHVDYSRVESYETELTGPYDPDYIPYCKEPAEATVTLGVNEDWTLKCSRAGVSENVILVPLWYTVACRPQPVLYTSGQEESTKSFFEKRIKMGMNLANETQAAFNKSKSGEHSILFRNMMLSIAWPKGKMAFKQHGYPIIFLDELSTYPNIAILDVIRKRGDNWAFSTIVGLSSPATEVDRPSEKDPIFEEFESGDQRHWMMKEPKGRGEFEYVFGGVSTEYGVKWDQNAKLESGEWDLNRVMDTAHYVTPAGNIITNDQRMNMCRKGYWKPTNPHALKGKRSRWINALMVPFKGGDFGRVAVAFLEAHRKGPQSMRAWKYEYMAERFDPPAKQSVEITAVRDRQQVLSFPRDIVPFSPRFSIFGTTDVQMRYGVYSVWAGSPTQHALIDHGYFTKWEQLDELKAKTYSTAAGEACRLQFLLLDTGHRTMECYRFALERKWVIPLKGDTGLTTSKSNPLRRSELGCFPNGALFGGNRKLSLLIIHPAFFKDEWMDMLSGVGIPLYFHEDIDDDYARQATGEVLMEDDKPDKNGNIRQWYKKIRKNDQFDCGQYSCAGRLLLEGDFKKWRVADRVEALKKQDKNAPRRISKRRGMQVING